MNYAFKTVDNKIGCMLCDEVNIPSYFSSYNSLRNHCNTRHRGIPPPKYSKLVKTKITCTSKNRSLTSDAPLVANLTNVNNNNISNNTIYFNKDLKYYPELVKIMGREKACNYLLYGMPETKDLFGVIDKLFLQNGAIGCPFRYDQDTGDFLIARAEGVFDRDPTGETIDRENKSKLQDAILSAYVDTTKHISRECADLRIARLNTEYTEADQEKLTRRFDALMTVEPIRPYEVIDLMNGLKPKKRDFDKIKKMCPAIIKKITIS